MANPTTYFGWVMPTSSSLVTNLPADFNTFGQGVDTSLQDLLGGTTGQVLSKTSGTNMDFTWVTPTDQTPLTTKGDLFTFSTVDARLGVGTNGQTLVADSAEATGLKWSTPATAASGMTFITSSTFSNVASVTLDGFFTSTYDQYVVTFTATFAGTGSDDAQLQFRYSGTTQASGYYGSNASINTSTSLWTIGVQRADSKAILSTNAGDTGQKSSGTMQVGGVGVATTYPTISGSYGNLNLEGSSFFSNGVASSNVMTGFLFNSSSSNVTGIIRVYGLAKS